MANDTKQSSRLAAGKAVGSIWWYFLIRGLLLLAGGLFLLFNPALTVVAFAQLIGLFLVIDGILALVAGITGRAKSRLWSMIRGSLMSAAGLFLLLRPAVATSVAAKTIFYVVGPIMILVGLYEIFATRRAQQANRKPKGSIPSGLLMSLLGLLLIIAPLFFGKLLLQLIGAVAILAALFLLFLAFKFHRRAKRIANQAHGDDDLVSSS